MNGAIERYTLIGITAFAALSALIGGYGVAASNGLGMPLSWLRTTPFADYTLPGLILLVVVGGSALVATVLLLVRQRWQYVVTFGAGAIMVGWIVGEVLLIRQMSWLQALYLSVGLAMMGLSLLFLTSTRSYARPTSLHFVPLRGECDRKNTTAGGQHREEQSASEDEQRAG